MNDIQKQKIEKYVKFLLQENEKYNLTAITEVDAVIQDHFADSLSILKLYPMNFVKSLIDVGSGAGFPGIPLAIMCPEMAVCLIEVNLKKVNFLKVLIAMLDLHNVTVCSDDWRTFLRSDLYLKLIEMDPRLREDEGKRKLSELENKSISNHVIPGFERESKSLSAILVVARASLQVDELLKMFKSSSMLKNGTLVYWASKKWIPTEQEKEYLDRCVEYEVGHKQRNLCFFKNK